MFKLFLEFIMWQWSGIVIGIVIGIIGLLIYMEIFNDKPPKKVKWENTYDWGDDS